MSRALDLRQLTADEARTLTDEVRDDAAALWAKLLQLYDGGAHTALGYTSWGAYYEEEFGESATKAYRVLRAARAVAELPTGQLPINERQARELARVEPERRAEVMAAASVDGPPTAARIREIGVRTGRAPDGTRERVTGTDPRIGEKALERIADGLRWVRHAGGPTVLVDAALQSSASSLLVEGWLHDVQRHIAALEEWRAALLATKNLRRVK